MDPKQFYFSFRGRVNRSVYWLKGVLPTYGVFYLMVMMSAVLVEFLGENIAIVLFAPILVLLWIGLAVGAKRSHDLDASAWRLLTAFIPCIGFLWLFIELGFLKGTAGPNRFGPDPLKTLKTDEPT